MNLFDNIFNQFTGKQAQPQVPNFATPQAPRTTNYVQPVVQPKTYTPWTGVATWFDATPREERPVYNFLQNVADVVTSLPGRLQETVDVDKKRFEEGIKNKQKTFVSEMLAEWHSEDSIFKALDQLKSKWEFDFKPWISESIVGGIGTRLQSNIDTTERLSKIQDPLDRTMAGVIPYAGQTVATALQPVTSALEPFVSPVVQAVIKKTGQTENIQALSEWWNEFEKTNPILAENIAGLLNVAQLAPVPIAKPLANIAKQGWNAIIKWAEIVAPKLVQGTKNIITKTPEFIWNTIGSTAEYWTSLATGLSKESQQIIKKSPELYKQARLWDITSEGELGNFAKATEARLTDLSEMGKWYDSIKKWAKISNAEEIGNIYLNRTKEIPTTQLTKADKIVLKDASDYMSQLKWDLKDSDILALRKQLDSISYDPNTGMKRKLSPQWARLVEGMRSDVDKIAKDRITGLKDLDTKYAPEVQLLKEIKSNIYDANGNIKNNALSTISNIVGKNKDLKLAKFEEIYPDLGKRLRALKAYEEVSSIASLKTGSIVRQLWGATVGTALAPWLWTIVWFIATNPHIVARILEAYWMVTSKAKSIVEKWTKITPQEIAIVKEAIKKVPKDKVEDIITNIKFNPKTENKNSKTLIKKPVNKKPIVKPNTIKNESKVNKPVSSDTIPEGYFKNVFWEIQKLPSNKNGGFLRIGSESKKLTDPLVEEARKYKSWRNMYDVMPYDMREKFDRIWVYSLKHFEDFYKKNITNTKWEITMYRWQSKPWKQVQFNDTKFQWNTDGWVFFTPNKDIAKKYWENIIELKSNKNNTLLYKEAEKLQKMAEKMVSSNIKNGITSKSIIEQMALWRPKAFAEYTKKPFLETWDMFWEQWEMIYYKNFDNK